MIDGVLVTPLKIIRDQRGAVYHIIRKDSDGFNGFGECYLSEISVGVTKGWKLHKLQTQNLVAINGRVRLVIVDERSKSVTKGNILNLIIGPEDYYCRVTVPPGLWYAFSCLSNFPAMLLNCVDIPHQTDESITCNLDDEKFPHSLFEN
jgi:dTDP-4-dehydrorhamnose 3,5-epimerase